MAQVPDKVLAWLYSVLHEYTDRNRSYNDIARVLSTFPALAPRTEVFTFQNGSSQLLCNLAGTLPTTFRGTTYHFPIKIWIPTTYPRESPWVFVTPGRDMQIRAGQHVGVDGRVYHPYLRDWSSISNRASVAELLGYVQQAFAKEPPLERKAAAPQAHQLPPPVNRPASYMEQRAQPPLPPKPGRAVSEMPVSGTPPPRPPKSDVDLANAYSEAPQRDFQRDGPPLPALPGQRLPSVSYNTGPPRPSYTPEGESYRSSSYGPPVVNQQRMYSPQGVERWQNVSRTPSMSYDQRTVVSPRPASQYGSPMQGQHANGSVDQRRVSYMTPQPPHQAPPQRRPAQDLLSDPFDVALPTVSAPPPPVPVNPEKEHLLQALSSTLVQQAQQKVNQNVSALTPLQAQQHALRSAYARLEAELAQVQALDAAIANNETILRRSIQECDHTIAAAKTKSLPPVDDVLVAQTLVAQQLWTAAADEAACREAMYVLQKAVDRGRINGSDFVRQMRGLGRECFLKMALARKCARGMGLDVGR